jgi:hypothetical protein
VLWDKDENGEADVSIHAGTVAKFESGYVLERGAQPSINLQPEWMASAIAVPEHLRKTMLEAEWFVRLNVHKLPDNADMTEYERVPLPNYFELLDKAGRRVRPRGLRKAKPD